MLRLVNAQRIPVCVSRLRTHINSMRAALDVSHSSVGVLLVSDQRIAMMNKRYRGVNGPTDVLSFPALEDRGIVGGQLEDLGDIIISVEYVRRTARLDRTTLAARMPVMVAHGLCHLLGHTHEDTEDSKQMRLQEQHALNAFMRAAAWTGPPLTPLTPLD
eukprot:m.35683 g.35683  ORF g.35683 m.35683 type:complete len:160 (+) comp5349_c0_seq2:67-546(+)